LDRTAKHTPYDGSHKPFTIGLQQLDLDTWIEIDQSLELYLTEKNRLYTDEFHNVHVEESTSLTAQQEVLDTLEQHLLTKFPQNYTLALHGLAHSAISVPILSEATRTFLKSSPLARAAFLVQEDLVLMRKSPQGWYLTAASVCFPSAWTLREKFQKPMHEIHGPVPGFNKDTRNAGLIERMFDNLRVDRPVIRWNWTLFGEAKLYHPASESGQKRRFGDGPIADHVFIRLERQTLRKLPQSGDILFTIKTHIDPVDVLKSHADGKSLAQSIIAQVEAFTLDELIYKGLTQERDKLLARLHQFA
jgi:dimethylamine monooxygenase subunit A